MKEFGSLLEMTKVFNDELACIQHLESIVWRNGKFCPHCGSVETYAYSNGKLHKCKSCRKQFTVRIGTIFEDSRLPLRKWFMAIYLLTSHKKGVSSHQLAKDIEVTQKTAWFVLHRLRYASRTQSFKEPLKGTIEVDETYIGGKEKNKHANKRTPHTQGRSTKTKTPVVGLVERGGNLRAFKAQDVTQKTIVSIVKKNTQAGSQVMTDEFRAYRALKQEYQHSFIVHSLKQYVQDNVHTNNIEGAWSHFKRMILGVYHHVSNKHMDRYLAEFCYRWNSKKDKTEGKRFNELLMQIQDRLTYKRLIHE